MKAFAEFLDLPVTYYNLIHEIRQKLVETTLYIDGYLSYFRYIENAKNEEYYGYFIDIGSNKEYRMNLNKIESVKEFHPIYGDTYTLNAVNNFICYRGFFPNYKKSYNDMWSSSYNHLGYNFPKIPTFTLPPDERICQRKSLPIYEGLLGEYKLHFPSCYVGLEFEFEQIQSYQYRGIFTAIDDGSLKLQGVEYVSKPIQMRFLEVELKRLFDKLNPLISRRCSMHVHVNMRDITTHELRKFVYLYTLHEKYLYSISGNRWNNNFCVPLRANHFVFDFLNGNDYRNNWGKYSGLNLLPLTNFGNQNGKGTVEFRMHEATLNVNRIMNFTNIITHLKKMVKRKVHWKDSPYPIDEEMKEALSYTNTAKLF